MFNIFDVIPYLEYILIMKNLAELGAKIKEKRLSLNLTMDSVSNQAGITRATLWYIETGKGNYSINSLMSVLKVLSLDLSFDNSTETEVSRERASRINPLLSKKINRFIVMCVEQYCLEYMKDGEETYKKMLDTGVVNELTNDYEDLHGMSTEYLNSYIHSLLEN